MSRIPALDHSFCAPVYIASSRSLRLVLTTPDHHPVSACLPARPSQTNAVLKTVPTFRSRGTLNMITLYFECGSGMRVLRVAPGYLSRPTTNRSNAWLWSTRNRSRDTITVIRNNGPHSSHTRVMHDRHRRKSTTNARGAG